MSLFRKNQRLLLVKENVLKLDTPLGDVKFELKINHSFIDLNTFSTFNFVESETFLSSKINQSNEINCLRAKFIPTLPPDIKVDNCFAFIWRIKALDRLDVNLSCFLDSSVRGSPEPGESLIAQTFEDNAIHLSIGTEDEEKLQLRAQNNEWVPTRFQSIINPDNICYLDHGIEVNFSLLKEEKIQIHFIVAWNSKNEHASSIWYAVDQSAADILHQLGIRVLPKPKNQAHNCKCLL